MRYVIIPDVHQEVTTLAAIVEAWRTPDTHFILLGDYFDSFKFSVENVEEMCRWLNVAAQSPDTFTLLYGNHDVHYLLPEGRARHRCSGYSSTTQAVIDGRLSDETRSRLRMQVWIGDDILCTHAGLTFPWLVQAFQPRDCVAHPPTPTEIRNFLNHQERLFFGGEDDTAKYRVRPEDLFLMAGRARGGHPTALGGLVWCDWYREFEPIPGVRQIVGHTVTDSHPASRHTFTPDRRWRGENWNIDTHLQYVALVDEGVIRTQVALPSAL